MLHYLGAIPFYYNKIVQNKYETVLPYSFVIAHGHLIISKHKFTFTGKRAKKAKSKICNLQIYDEWIANISFNTKIFRDLSFCCQYVLLFWLLFWLKPWNSASNFDDSTKHYHDSLGVVFLFLVGISYCLFRTWGSKGYATCKISECIV